MDVFFIVCGVKESLFFAESLSRIILKKILKFTKIECFVTEAYFVQKFKTTRI